ncbi:MAG: DUF3263 domain-containing protein [Pseudolysinimonas sp.]
MREMKTLPGAPEPTEEPPTVAQLLEFEDAHARDPHKSDLARTRWGYAPARYEQVLQLALATVEALEHNAELTHRLLRQRESRTAARGNRTFTRQP